MRKFDLSLRSLRSSYFATFRHQLTILSKTDALDEEKWLNMLGTFVKDWFRYESHFVHGRDSLVDILKERGLLSEYMHKMRCLLINRRSLLLALRLLWKTPIFPSNSRFPRLCAKCLLKLKRLVSILPMTKSKK